MADFLIAYKRTAVSERGYTKEPSDNGNWTGGQQGVGKLIGTKDGIGAHTLSAYLGRPATEQEMRNLDEPTRRGIYKKNYWDEVWGDRIAFQASANEIYDEAVNFGPPKAIKFQEVIFELRVTGKMSEKLLKK